MTKLKMLLLLLFLRSDTVSASQTFLLIISSVSSRVSHSVWAQKPFWSEVWDLKYFCSVLILALYTLTGLELLCICVSPELQRRTRGFEDTWLLVQHEHPPVETQARLSRSWNSMTDWLSVQLPKYTNISPWPDRLNTAEHTTHTMIIIIIIITSAFYRRSSHLISFNITLNDISILQL